VSRRERLLLLGLIALAALLRFATLDAKGLWEDEAGTAFLARMDLVSMLGEIYRWENTPPLFFLLTSGWVKLFGTGEVGLRSLAALFGVAVVPVGYLLGREFVSPRTGLFTSGLLAVNPLLIWYSQEARAYSLLVLTGALALWFCARATANLRSRDLTLWALAASLSLATHYFAVFLVIPEILWLLYALGRRRAVLVAIGATIGVGAALLPLALAQSHEKAAWIAQMGLAGRVVQIPGIFLVGFESPLPLLTAGVAALLAGYGIWLLLRRADKAARKRALIAAGVGAAAILLPLVLALIGLDFFNYKNVIASVVPLTVAVAAGFAAPRAGRRGIGAATALAALSLAVVAATAWEPKYHREAWREAARALGPPGGPRAVVATPTHGEGPLEYYLPGARLRGGGLARVNEIDVLALRRRPLGAIATPRLPPATAPPAPPAPGFRLIERRDQEYFRLFRYRSARGVRVQIGDLERMTVDRVEPVILVQRGGLPRRPPTSSAYLGLRARPPRVPAG
jgi:4-amino-4-deoxy-L-arabinose transferase-like glycosyltransferase